MVDIPVRAVEAAIEAAGMEGWDHVEERMKAALTADAPHMSGAKVKQLEWSDPSAPNADCSYDHAFSDTSIGKYQIEWKSWKEYDAYVLYLDGDYITSEIDLPTAKSAAQADFEARILSALEPSSAREHALEEAAKKAEELLVYADTTSRADKVIPAAIRALKSQPAPQTGGRDE